MQWQGGRRSTNIEDRRGMGGAGMVGGGGIGMKWKKMFDPNMTKTSPRRIRAIIVAIFIGIS